MLYMVVLVIFSPELTPVLWMNGVALLRIIIALRLAQSGSVDTASMMVCIPVWALITYYVWIDGGIASPAFGILGIVIILGGLLLGEIGALTC